MIFLLGGLGLGESRADTLSIYFPPALNVSPAPSFVTSTDQSLEGFTVRAGAFSVSASQLLSNLSGQTTADDIRNTVHASFTQYDSFSMSNGFASDPAQAVVSLETATGALNNANFKGRDVFLLFYNNSDVSAATEMGIFRMAFREDNSNLGIGIFSTGAQFTGERAVDFYFADGDGNIPTESYLNLLIGQYDATANAFRLGALAGGIGQITSPLAKTNTTGSVLTYQIQANNGPDRYFATTNTAGVDLTETNLPTGFSMSTNTGVITVATNAVAGTNTIRLVASNSLTAVVATNTLTWVLQAAPVISSSLTATATRGSAFSYQITAENFPTSYNATGLPTGLSINTTTGLISGTPTAAAGTFTVTLSAANATGTGTANLTLTLNAIPQISSTNNAIATRNSAFSYQITADSSPTSYDATGLPVGLSVNTSTGLISGTPTAAAGTFTVTLSAANATGTGTLSLTLEVTEPLLGAPVISSALTATATRGSAFSYQITASSSPTSYNATGLPAGLSINASTGLISGNPTAAAGTFIVTLSAANGTGAGTANLTLTLNASPQITSALTATATRGSAFSYQITADSSPTSYNATGLPTGLSVNTTNGLISGTPTVAAGTFTVTLSAANATGTGTANLTVNLSATPRITSANTQTATRGVSFSFPVTADSSPSSFAASSLPAGLTINATSGLITGIPTASAGVFTNSLSASNATGTGPATNFILTLLDPTIAVPNGDLTGGQLVVTAGTARTSTVTKTANFTNLTGTVEPATTGVSFDGTSLIIATNAQPLAKRTTNVTLTLTATRVGTPVSASTTVPLRIVAPVPTALVGTNEFEVDVGQLFSTSIVTDVGALARMSFSNLPSGLTSFANGTVSGTNTSTNLPFEFVVPVRADSSIDYEGGGVFTSSVTMRLRNTNAPYFAPATNRYLLALGRSIPAVNLQAFNFPFRYTASNLPAGLQLVGANISGTPTAAGRFEVPVVAYNAFRPGSTNPADWQTGSGTLIFHVADARPPTSVAPTSPGALSQGAAIALTDNRYLLDAASSGVNVAAYGLPPGISLDATTGKIYGTPTSRGTYTATVFIQNGRGWIKKTVTLTVQ